MIFSATGHQRRTYHLILVKARVQTGYSSPGPGQTAGNKFNYSPVDEMMVSGVKCVLLRLMTQFSYEFTCFENELQKPIIRVLYHTSA